MIAIQTLAVGMIATIVIAITFIEPRTVLFIFMFVLLAFNDYIGGLPSSIINIGGRQFYAADFFVILLSAGLIRALFRKDLISKIDRPVLVAMLIFSIYGLAGILIGADHDYLYNDIIGDFRRYFYYPWAIFIPMLVLRDRHDIKIIEKAAFAAALIICIFALHRIVTGQTFFPEVHALAHDNFRAMGFHDYIILIFVICLSIGKIIQNKRKRNLLAKAYLILLPPFVIASNFRVAWALLVICPGIVLYMFWSGRISLKPLRKIAFLGLLGIILFGVTAKTTGNKAFLELEARFSSQVINYTSQESPREDMWAEVISEWKVSPLLGVGLGKVIFYMTRAHDGDWYWKQAGSLHNSYLELGLKTGIIGLALFLLMQGMLAVRCFKSFKRTSMHLPFTAAGITFIFSMLVQTGIQPFLTQPNSIVLIYLIIGAVINVQYLKEKSGLEGKGNSSYLRQGRAAFCETCS